MCVIKCYAKQVITSKKHIYRFLYVYKTYTYVLYMYDSMKNSNKIQLTTQIEPF